MSIEKSNEILLSKPIDFELADISKLNFKHSKLIENSVDFMKEFHSYSYINNKKNQILSETNENLVKSIEDSKIVLSTIGN